MAVNKVRRNGSYAPLSAHYYKDDAIAEAGEAAELLYVRGLAFCADVLNDGFISETQLSRFVGVGMRDATKRAKRLVDAGLWLRETGGYRVKSWLGWNRSRSDIMDYQQKDRDRKRPEGSESDEPTPDPPAGTRTDSERNPDGNQLESDALFDRSPNGFHPRARTPLHSTPSNVENSQPATAAAVPDVVRREDVEELCRHLHDCIVANGSKASITIKWRTEARLLLDRDKRPLEEALRLIDWCQGHAFWRSNILGMPKFRGQYDKLRLQANSPLRAVAGDIPDPAVTGQRRVQY